MKKYLVTLRGCDDSTYKIIELTQKEYEICHRVLEEVSDESTYGCMPTAYIREAKEEDLEQQSRDIKQKELEEKIQKEYIQNLVL